MEKEKKIFWKCKRFFIAKGIVKQAHRGFTVANFIANKVEHVPLLAYPFDLQFCVSFFFALVGKVQVPALSSGARYSNRYGHDWACFGACPRVRVSVPLPCGKCAFGYLHRATFVLLKAHYQSVFLNVSCANKY